jgi:hypothetical protein
MKRWHTPAVGSPGTIDSAIRAIRIDYRIDGIRHPVRAYCGADFAILCLALSVDDGLDLRAANDAAETVTGHYGHFSDFKTRGGNLQKRAARGAIGLLPHVVVKAVSG